MAVCGALIRAIKTSLSQQTHYRAASLHTFAEFNSIARNPPVPSNYKRMARQDDRDRCVEDSQPWHLFELKYQLTGLVVRKLLPRPLDIVIPSRTIC
jgi:hypothetical protein